MAEKLLTVFTPAYNRAYCLESLYKSLLRQTSDNFLWYVVDDGSEDNTKEIVESWISENKIKIMYEYQNNAGKHVAHNRGVEMCSTDLFFCVDSDDELSPDAVEVIEREWKNEVENVSKISGMVAYRAHRDFSLIGTPFPENCEKSALRELYDMGFKGDTALIFRTEVLKKYKFPVFAGERFMRENIVYDKIDEEYKLKIVREKIYLCEYLEDGLSRNASRLELKSPKGAALYRLGEYKRAVDWSTKVRNCAAFVLFSSVAHDLTGALKEIGIIKTALMLPIALAGYIRFYFKGAVK